MEDNQVSPKLQSIVNAAICKVANHSQVSQRPVRLDVRVEPVTIMSNKPHCVALRLVHPTDEKIRLTGHVLRDKRGRNHCLSVMLMSDLGDSENIHVMYNAEYCRSTRLHCGSETERYSSIEMYSKDQIALTNEMVDRIAHQITEFLSRGLIQGKPYKGFEPNEEQ